MTTILSESSAAGARANPKTLDAFCARAADMAGLTAADGDILSVCLLSPKRMAAMNEKFVGHQGVTDVITFDYADPAGPDDNLRAEIFVCPAVAKSEAESRGGDFAAELALYVVHGILHLAGFDDIAPADRREMRKAERRLMKTLGKEFDPGKIFKLKSQTSRKQRPKENKP